MNKNRKYYLINKKIVGKMDDGFTFIWTKDGWVSDKGNIIYDHLCGYDSFEPDGSPYGFDSMSIKDDIESIFEEEAIKIIINMEY